VPKPAAEFAACHACGLEFPASHLAVGGGMCEDCDRSANGERRCLGCGAWSETVYCGPCGKTAVCPHGARLRAGCGRCDVESDRAFDAAREAGR